MTLGVMQVIEMGSRLAAGAFVSGIWQGVVLAAAVGLVLHAIPKTTAAIRFMVWSAVFLVLALLPLLRGFALKTDGAIAGHGALHAIHVDVRWSFAIAAVWALLSGIRAVGLVSSAVRLRKIWKRATPVDAGFESGLLRAGNGRAVQICTSADVDCPSVIGFFSPRVLIPVEMFERLTATELEQIVLHEVGHLRRADDWINLLQKIGLVVFPLNPALLWVERRLCFERELACDDGVLRLTKAPKAYATCLTTLAEHRLERRGLSLSLGAWERQSELSRRVHSILRWREGTGRTQARMAVSALALGLLGGATVMARCPQLVSFSSATLPLAQEAQTLPTGDFQSAVFRPTSAAHETLLKASMPSSDMGLKTAGQPTRQKSHHSTRPALRRVRKIRSQGQQWLVLTSWNETGVEPGNGSAGESGGAKMILTVAREQNFYASYAAVRTAGGWLVFQL
jgi:beta-lactamase regulating signal transducer with metallopeptidase domain